MIGITSVTIIELFFLVCPSPLHILDNMFCSINGAFYENITILQFFQTKAYLKKVVNEKLP